MRDLELPRTSTGARALRGPLLVVSHADGAGWDEATVIEVAGGDAPPRAGIVVEVVDDLAVVQVLDGTEGLALGGLRLRFQGRPLDLPVGEGWLGRTCDGRGRPRDGGPPVLSSRRLPVAGRPLNPLHREPPREPIVTGVSAVDALMTLVRGQKLPIFSVAGLPHLELAAQIAAQAHVGGEPFCVVFAAMGLTHGDADLVQAALEERAAMRELVLVLNLADDPMVERVLTPRVALTVAQDLAFTHGRHVLVLMVDMTSYAEAVREISSVRGELPGRRAYPGHLYSDLASLYERCGRVRGRPGSVTVVPVLTMPAGDMTHPVADLTGYITEGQIVLSPELHGRGVYPPVDPLQSLSRLMRSGVGPGRTREDHLPLAGQLIAALAHARTAAELAEMVGVEALSATDTAYLDLAERLEQRLLDQAPDESRELEETLDRCWEVLAALPDREVTMISSALRETWRPTDAPGGQPGREQSEEHR